MPHYDRTGFLSDAMFATAFVNWIDERKMQRAIKETCRPPSHADIL